jgi:hypothetical protein
MVIEYAQIHTKSPDPGKGGTCSKTKLAILQSR